MQIRAKASSMSSWLLLVFLFLIWILWAVAASAQKSLQDAQRGLPKGQRGNMSVFPVIPVFPLAFWGIAVLVDQFAAPWGTRTIGVLHSLFFIVLVASICRDWWRLRNIDCPPKL